TPRRGRGAGRAGSGEPWRQCPAAARGRASLSRLQASAQRSSPRHSAGVDSTPPHLPSGAGREKRSLRTPGYPAQHSRSSFRTGEVMSRFLAGGCLVLVAVLQLTACSVAGAEPSDILTAWTAPHASSPQDRSPLLAHEMRRLLAAAATQDSALAPWQREFM